MQSNLQTAPTSKAMRWTGIVIGCLPALMLIFAGAMNLAKTKDAVEGAMKYGYPEHAIVWMGLAAVVSAILYLIPRTAMLGAILLTGYLGGAVATHVRADEGLVRISFPVLFGVLLWGGLYFRDSRIRSLVPFRS
jgi:hypothetical protein